MTWKNEYMTEPEQRNGNITKLDAIWWPDLQRLKKEKTIVGGIGSGGYDDVA